MTLSPAQLIILASLDQYKGEATRAQIYLAIRRVSPQPHLDTVQDIGKLHRACLIECTKCWGHYVRITQKGREYITEAIPIGSTSMCKYPFTPAP